jgi:hypothetical protein
MLKNLRGGLSARSPPSSVTEKLSAVRLLLRQSERRLPFDEDARLVAVAKLKPLRSRRGKWLFGMPIPRSASI